MRKQIAAGALVAIAAAGLAACGGDDEDPTVGADETATSTAATEGEEQAADDFNDADVVFAQSMIPHHEEAIEMAALADGRTDSQEVLELAARIEAAQQLEIERMREWLSAWGEDETGMDMGMDSGMSMNAEDMAALDAASGAEFDRMFLEMMIEHHRGAITMAETEMAEGMNPDAIELAQQVIEDQQGEIAEMEVLLEEVG